MPSPEMRIIYTNYRGVTSERRIIPLMIWYGESEFHKAEGKLWFLKAFDHDKGENRDFAMKDIKEINQDDLS